ncbi:MAG: hypothetical protein IJX70_05210, partial [Clostridia bacterium]|nr:hypothetical protein [Clostridia bacterium]
MAEPIHDAGASTHSSIYPQPCIAGFHRDSDFIHRKWISSVKDGFICESPVLSLPFNRKAFRY